MRNRMICLGLSSPSKVQPYPLYTEIGWVHSGLGGCVYGLQAPKSKRVLKRCSMGYGSVVEPKNTWALSYRFVLTLYVSGCVVLDRPPQVYLLESSWR